MSNNVAEELAQKKPLLLQKIESNPDLADVLMALLGRIILECAAKGYKINAVVMGPINETNGAFKSHIVYTNAALTLPPSVRIGVHSDFLSYLGNKNSSMAMVLRINHSIAEFFEALIHQIESYATHKRIPFNKLKVVTNGAFIDRDNMLVITVGKEDKGATKSTKLKKFFGID